MEASCSARKPSGSIRNKTAVTFIRGPAVRADENVLGGHVDFRHWDALVGVEAPKRPSTYWPDTAPPLRPFIARNGFRTTPCATDSPSWRPASADNALVYDLSLGLPKGETLPLTPEALKIKAARLAKDDPEANCLPTGVPRLAPFPWRILQTPTHIFFLFEGNIHSYRQIFMDGRPHPPDPDPTWYGHSTGRWDKDTLIIDTVGFNDRSWFDFEGHPHTGRLHTTERYMRPNLGTLIEEVTIDDPGAYTHPFTVSSTHRLLLNDELIEYVCQENEKDTHHLRGPATPP